MWIGWGGGGGADYVYDVCVCPCTPTVMQRIKPDRRQCTSPFGWTDQPEKTLLLFPPKAGSKRPQCKPHPTPSRGKRLRGTPTSLPTPSEDGGRNLFHLLGVGVRNNLRRITWTCLPGKPYPFTHVTTCIQKMTRGTN